MANLPGIREPTSPVTVEDDDRPVCTVSIERDPFSRGGHRCHRPPDVRARQKKYIAAKKKLPQKDRSGDE
jgi:hypothetical protein